MNDGKQPVVSIVMPCYNYAQFIDESVASVKRQTYQNWELIIVDDGSTDNTQTVLEKFQNDQRIITIRQDNGGVSKARNAGLAIAKGEYIAFLDADDIWSTNKLERLLSLLESYDGVFASSNFIRFSDNEAKYGSFLDYCHQLRRELDAAPTKDHLYVSEPLNIYTETLEMPWYPSANIISRKKCGHLRFDESKRLGEDIDYFLKVWSIGGGIFVGESLLRLRVHENNASKAGKNHHLLVLKLYEQHVRWLQENQVESYEQSVRIMKNRIIQILSARALLDSHVFSDSNNCTYLRHLYAEYRPSKSSSYKERAKFFLNKFLLRLKSVY